MLYRIITHMHFGVYDFDKPKYRGYSARVQTQTILDSSLNVELVCNLRLLLQYLQKLHA